MNSDLPPGRLVGRLLRQTLLRDDVHGEISYVLRAQLPTLTTATRASPFRPDAQTSAISY
jgi:hypothetical protein